MRVATYPSDPDAAANDRWPEPARRAAAVVSNTAVSTRLLHARECGRCTEGGAGVGGARPHSISLAHCPRPRSDLSTVRREPSSVTRKSLENTR